MRPNALFLGTNSAFEGAFGAYASACFWVDEVTEGVLNQMFSVARKLTRA
jgi:hypothetical protein